MAVTLMPHQKEAVEKLSSGKILYGGVGSGKSITALAYYAEKDTLGDLYIITTAKKRDSLEWMSDAAKYGIGLTKDSTVHGVMTVDSWNNISKYVDVKNCTFIFDEQRLVGKGAWVKSFYKIAKKNSWLILSATPGDTWSDFIPVFVANGYYKNMTQFSREHIIWSPYTRFPKIERYVGVSKLEKHKEEVLIEMPFEMHTTRKVHYHHVEYDKELFKRASVDRWNPYTDEPIANVAELFSVMRRIVYTHPSRLAAVRELMERHPRLIVFYNFNYELNALRELNDTWSDLYQIAEWNGHKKEPIPDSDNWVYLVQYQAGAEGWNCTSTDAMVFYSLTYSYKRFEQAQGRIDRMTTLYTSLSYFALISDSMIDRAVRESLKRKKTFNEKRWFESIYGENDELFQI
jgi:hypothetical protein